MTYLTGNDLSLQTKSQHNASNKVLKTTKSAEGQVFERLAKQAEIYHNIQKQKRELKDQDMTDPKTGNEFFKPQINQSFLVRDRPSQ